MAIFNLVEGVPSPIVECYDLDLPIPINPVFEHNKGYDTPDGFKRYTGTPMLTQWDIETKYFKNLFDTQIVPLIVKHQQWWWSWPITAQSLIKKTSAAVAIMKDEIGWEQGIHADPNIFPVSGVVHLQDCEQGTYFPEGRYTAPTKKFSGAFWANTTHSSHMVPKVTTERYGYLIVVRWDDLPGEWAIKDR